MRKNKDLEMKNSKTMLGKTQYEVEVSIIYTSSNDGLDTHTSIII